MQIRAKDTDFNTAEAN